MLSQASLRELRAYYRALASGTRLRIVQLLATEGDQTAHGIADRLKLSQPLLSWHLRRLTRAGVVRTRRVGREQLCSFDRDTFATLHDRGYRTLMNRARVE